MSNILDETRGWRALVVVDPMSLGRLAKILLVREVPNQGTEVLRLEGGQAVLTFVGEAQPFPDDAGLELPVDAINALGLAIEKFQGDTGHAKTEIRVLREWLGEEKQRVNQLIAAAITINEEGVR